MKDEREKNIINRIGYDGTKADEIASCLKQAIV
jgi:hypothetical protein